MAGHAFGNVALPGAAQRQACADAFGLLCSAGGSEGRSRHGLQGRCDGIHLLIRQRSGYRLHDRVAARTGTKVFELLAAVARSDSGKSRKARRCHSHRIGAMAGRAGHGGWVGTPFCIDRLPVGGLCLHRQQQRSHAGQGPVSGVHEKRLISCCGYAVRYPASSRDALFCWRYAAACRMKTLSHRPG